MEKAYSENNLLSKKLTSQQTEKQTHFAKNGPKLQSPYKSRGVFNYDIPINEIYPRSQSLGELSTISSPLSYDRVSRAVNPEGEILSNVVLNPADTLPLGRCVVINDYHRATVLNLLLLTQMWDYPIKYIIGFDSQFTNVVARHIGSPIIHGGGGSFISGCDKRSLVLIAGDISSQNYSLLLDVPDTDTLFEMAPILNNSKTYAIYASMALLPYLTSYADYLIIPKHAEISKEYEAKLSKKNTGSINKHNLLKYSISYKLAIASHYLDKLTDDEFLVIANPFNSITIDLWYVRNSPSINLSQNQSSNYLTRSNSPINYFDGGGSVRKRDIKRFFTTSRKIKKMQTVLSLRGAPDSLFYKEYFPKDIFLIIFYMSFGK